MRGLWLGLAAALAWRAVAQIPAADEFERRIREAQQAQSRSDFSRAAAAYQHALELRPDSPELWANAGLMRYQLGDFGAAAKSFDKALRLRPGLFVPTLFLGLSYVEMNRPREAIGYLERAAAANPKDAQAPLALGRAHYKLKQHPTANKWFRRAAELNPGSGEAWYGAGMTYLELAEHAGGVLASEHEHSAYFQALAASTLENQRRFASAVATYQKVLDSSDAPPCSRTDLGFALLGRRDMVSAESELEADLHNGCAAARLGLARLAFQRRNDQEAFRLIDQIVSADAGFMQAHASRLWDGLPEAEAADVQRKTATVRSQVVSSHDTDASEQALPVAAYAKGKYKLCTDTLSARLAQLQGAELRLLAACSFATGDYETTAAASGRLIRERPQGAAGWYWAVKADQRLAILALARAGEADPVSPRMHLLLGDAYRQKEMFRDARAAYTKALELGRDRFPALLGLAATAYRASNLDEALSQINAALELRPKDAEANLLAGEILIGQRQYVAAEPYVKASLGVKPAALPRVHALLGRIYLATGRLNEALQELKQGVASDEDGSVYYQLGRTYKALGDEKSAEAAMQKSKALRTKRLNLAQEALEVSGRE